MERRFEIIWDGQAPGLSDHRLSLAAFGPALTQLLAAFRRVASDIQLQARGPAAAVGRGRLAREAENLDIQIETVTGNSPVHVSAQIVELNPPERPLLGDLPEQALDKLLRDIEREAQGMPAHHSVRAFLKALPDGLESQRYIQKAADGRILRDVRIGAMSVTTLLRAPHLMEVSGILVAVGFEEGRQEVKVRSDSGELVAMTSTSALAEKAIDLRLQHVRLLGVSIEGQRPRLIDLTAEEILVQDPGPRLDRVFSDWRVLLQRLAQ